MFDLFRSRDKAVRILLTAILSLVTLSMIGYLIPTYGGSEGSPNDNVVADVGSGTVTVREVQNAIQLATRSREIPPAMLANYIPTLIQQMITEKALIYQANRLGIKVSEADAAKAIREQMPNLFPNGQFVGKEAYAAMLAQRDLTIPQFEQSMADQLLLNRFRNIVLESTVVSKADIEQQFKLKNEKAAIEYVKIDPQKLLAELKPSTEELKGYYEKNKAGYRIPEKRSLKLIIVDPAKIVESVQIAPEKVRMAYEQNKERYRVPERARARHILVMTQGKPPAEEAKLKVKAEDILKQVKAGGNFAELAKKYSDDPGSKDKGGELDWFGRGQMVPEFEAATFALKPNDISGVVKTAYGFHIIQVEEKQDAHLRTFDEVKTELTAELKKQMGQNLVQNTLDEAQSAIKKNPQDLDQIAAKDHLTVIPKENVGPGDPMPEIGVNRDFEDSLAGLKKGEVSQPVSVPGGRMLMAVVTDIIPAHPATFEEAERQVRSAYLFDQSAKLAAQKADELIAKVKAMNGDLDAAAKSMGLTVVKAPAFSRNAAIEGLGSPDAIPETFTKPAGTVFGPTMIGNLRVIGKITERIEPNMAELAAQTDAIRDDIKHTKARERDAPIRGWCAMSSSFEKASSRSTRTS